MTSIQEPTIDPEALASLMRQAKLLAKQYRLLTGRPLGVTGEIAEYEAARLLGLKLSAVRQAGYDAIREMGSTVEKIQIKARCLLPGAKPGQRIGRIQLEKEWDTVVLVILDEDLNPVIIYEARRPEVTVAITAPGSRARNERGALPMAKFRSIGKTVWSREKAVSSV